MMHLWTDTPTTPRHPALPKNRPRPEPYTDFDERADRLGDALRPRWWHGIVLALIVVASGWLMFALVGRAVYLVWALKHGG